jgi:hypothetical protein
MALDERQAGHVLALLGATAFVLFFAANAFLSSHKRAGENSNVDIALRKASFSCFSIMPAARAPYSFNSPSDP